MNKNKQFQSLRMILKDQRVKLSYSKSLSLIQHIRYLRNRNNDSLQLQKRICNIIKSNSVATLKNKSTPQVSILYIHPPNSKKKYNKSHFNKTQFIHRGTQPPKQILKKRTIFSQKHLKKDNSIKNQQSVNEQILEIQPKHITINKRVQFLKTR